ncbi:MAG: hypothetical protein EHM80_14230 [Nitrospiraceae bacterium]|nr:MAG: hypothetical protein EHM80_14230 [Nitrospiraceae bacterium]
MAQVQQQAMEFPFRTEDGGEIIDAPRHLLAELRRSAVSSDRPKGLVLLSGSPSVYRLGLCAAVDRALAGEPVLYLAGANVFDPFLVGRLARVSRVAPAQVLQQIHVSRAFTCHQMVRLVTDCLPSALRTYDARFVILAGPLDTLYDQSVPESEAIRLFRAMTEALQHMAEQGIQVLCVSPLAPPESGGRSRFVAALRAQARQVIDLCEAEDGLWLQEEGGPEPRRWMIPRPLWNRL